MYYKNQTVLLASKHEKEQVIAPPFMSRLSCSLEVHDFDTDQFGTFTGEIARTLSPYETCLLKAQTAAKRFNYSLAVASEGSFGPHPAFPFVPSAHELMVFVDGFRDWIIAEQLVSQKTNYETITINKNTELDAFLKRVGFPSHALILQEAMTQRVLAKGINNVECLNDNLKLGFKTEKELLLTTDMRAMMNPTRMEVIGELADKLTQRIASLCARCERPGFGFKATRGALLCSLCGSPTSFYEEEVWGCIACEHQEYKMRRDGLLKADPTHCDYCNP
ncbi:DUF6671 family protein [Legionella waltersii]|uniref:DUF6671 domain-containing protein n=1 Tax=Legionella waltersii TaxID=66969 RepID=A0A0W1ALH1_9GAMM|nr:DUF6671 family protein [Legionella waltersii]KTD82203.1 hypothetical protein Lwal_0680 [Legionella waltersii]SNV10698.1 Uncharacterised protein [Legionella waltersii]